MDDRGLLELLLLAPALAAVGSDPDFGGRRDDGSVLRVGELNAGNVAGENCAGGGRLNSVQLLPPSTLWYSAPTEAPAQTSSPVAATARNTEAAFGVAPEAAMEAAGFRSCQVLPSSKERCNVPTEVTAQRGDAEIAVGTGTLALATVSTSVTLPPFSDRSL